ncbi:transcriptional regulator [Gluconobacter frateurii NBRC 103465]|nr:transcriptional regulator [Gluconobacter frateurii NBRC 103465]
MLDGITLDQIRTFLAATDEGSFSAAGRRLGRAQSVVSQTLANLEGQLGLLLFDRTNHKPVLTDHGKALLEKARAVVNSMDGFKARAKSMTEGVESELAIVVDVMFPIERLAMAVGAFRDAFTDVPLRVHVEALGAVLQPVIDGHCAFGIMGSLPVAPNDMTTEALSSEEMIMVAAPGHPLSAIQGLIPTSALANHTQLILTDRSPLSEGRHFGIMSSKRWHLADLGAKLAFLRAGLGWGSMPHLMVEADLKMGTLTRLQLAGGQAAFMMPMLAVYCADSLPGPAGRWLIEKLKQTE